ncbi:Zinc finger BED domain-containing protein RICESLEEPER 1 [Bienertia sinuspersici]
MKGDPSSEDPFDSNAHDGVEALGGEGGGNSNAQERQSPPKRPNENVDTSTQSKELSKTLGVPTDEDWVRIASMLPFLKNFYDATLRLSRSLYATSNVYLQELFSISKMIKKKSESNDFGEKFMAHGIKKKHDEYLENVGNINLMLYIVVVLDPRRKMYYVKWDINDQYELSKSFKLHKMVMDTFTSLYSHYNSQHTQNVTNP